MLTLPKTTSGNSEAILCEKTSEEWKKVSNVLDVMPRILNWSEPWIKLKVCDVKAGQKEPVTNDNMGQSKAAQSLHWLRFHCYFNC